MSSEEERVRDVVRDNYARVAEADSGDSSGCAPASSCCGTGSTEQTVSEVATTLGYTEDEIRDLPGGSNLGLGCGNPTALASLKPGEVVVDLGSGAGFDALLSAEKLGPQGRFIGVDMTSEMLEQARTNAVNGGYARTVEFREGFIENLPVASDTVAASPAATG